MDLLKFGVKHTVVKLQTLDAVGMRDAVSSLGISVLRMRILNFVLCTLYGRVIFGARAALQLPISHLLWPFPGL